MAKFNLADDVIAALNNPKKGIFAAQDVRHIQAFKDRCHQKYIDMRKATRFVLDDRFLEFAMEQSMIATCSELLRMLPFARMPNDLTWIEWNEHLRQEVLQRVARDKFDQDNPIDWSAISHTVGYLLEDAPFTGYEGDSFIGTPFVPFNDPASGKEMIGAAPLSIQFAVCEEGSGFTEAHHRYFLKDFTGQTSVSDDELLQHIKAEHNVSIDALGGWWAQHNQKTNPKETGEALFQLCNHIRLLQGPGIDFYLDVANAEWNEETAARIQAVGQDSIRGDARFLITVLALLNFDWVIQSPRQASTDKQYKFGKFRRGNSHIQIEIDLPKPRGISIIPREFRETEGIKRLHDVRGHFRRLRGGTRVWVRAHKRGNKELGTITKDYVLTNKSGGSLHANR